MITVEDLFAGYPAHPEITEEFKASAHELLVRVNDLLAEAESNGVHVRTNPHTNTCVSGQHDGGWRPQSCPTGAPHSAHKQAQAVDVYDPGNVLDAYITAHPEILVAFDLYRESPVATQGWCHLSTRAPGSGRRTFLP